MDVVHRKQIDTGNEKMLLKPEAGYQNEVVQRSLWYLPSAYLERFSNLNMRRKLLISKCYLRLDKYGKISIVMIII